MKAKNTNATEMARLEKKYAPRHYVMSSLREKELLKKPKKKKP